MPPTVDVGCTNLPEGAARACTRPALYHVATTGRTAGWLCEQCGRTWLGYGKFAELHTISDRCHTGACSVHQVARRTS